MCNKNTANNWYIRLSCVIIVINYWGMWDIVSPDFELYSSLCRLYCTITCLYDFPYITITSSWKPHIIEFVSHFRKSRNIWPTYVSSLLLQWNIDIKILTIGFISHNPCHFDYHMYIFPKSHLSFVFPFLLYLSYS